LITWLLFVGFILITLLLVLFSGWWTR